MSLLYVADIISVMPIFYSVYFILRSLESKQYIDNLVPLIGMNLATSSCEIIKLITKQFNLPPILKKIIMRPPGAKNTDYLSRNGPKPPNTPGFPSGHMTSTSFFSTYIILEKYYNKKYNNLSEFFKNEILLIIFHFIIVGLMSFSRYYKGVHNFTQIIVGSLLGNLLAYLTFIALHSDYGQNLKKKFLSLKKK